MADTITVPTNEATVSEPTPIVAETTEQVPTIDEHTLEEEIEEELIIEDFTIDGICGVY
jgi:mycofactocin precursor